MTPTDAEGTSPAPRRRRSIFRDDSADAVLPDPWALAGEPLTTAGGDGSGDPRSDRPLAAPAPDPASLSENDHHTGPAR